MAAYLIVESEVIDAEKFKAYQVATPPLVAAVGGRYLVRGGAITVAEGDWSPQRMTVVEFPDRKTAEAFYASAGYTAARALRAGAAKFKMIIVDGFSPA